MNSQQRRNFLIGGLVGALLLGFLVYRMFLAPLAELNREFEKAYDEAEAKQKEWEVFKAEKKKLEHVRLLGVPWSAQEGVSEYDRYLKTIFDKAGVERKDVEISDPKEADARNQAGVKKGQAGHVVRTFQVKARITWPSLLVFLAKFQQTPLLHRIKTFNIEKIAGSSDDGGKLTVSMAIETLSVARSTPKVAPGKFDPKARPENLWGVEPQVMAFDAVADLYHAPIGWAMILRGQALLVPKIPAGRDYADLNLRNPFVGPVPPVAITKKSDNAKDKNKEDKDKELVKDKTPSINVLQYLKFEGFSGVQQDEDDKREVFLHNLLKPLSRSDAYVTLTNNKSFVILDDDGKKPVLKGKVLRIDQRIVYFEVGDAIYAMSAGETMWDAMWDEIPAKGRTRAKLISRALSRTRLEELGLQKVLEPVEK